MSLYSEYAIEKDNPANEISSQSIHIPMPDWSFSWPIPRLPIETPPPIVPDKILITNTVIESVIFF